MSKFIQVITTVSDKNEAEIISENILKNKYAACSQIIGPIKSKYWWKGKLEESDELYCVFKTKKDLFKKIKNEIIKLHSYEVPEIIAVPIKYGFDKYLKWIDDETK
jgi:periplasmic divalent cation tolerance protein